MKVFNLAYHKRDLKLIINIQSGFPCNFKCVWLAFFCATIYFEKCFGVLFFVHTMKVNGVHFCFGLHWLSLHRQNRTIFFRFCRTNRAKMTCWWPLYSLILGWIWTQTVSQLPNSEAYQWRTLKQKGTWWSGVPILYITVTARVFLVRDAAAIIMRYSKTSFDSVSLSVIDGRSHTYSYCCFMPQFCFCLTVNSKVFPFLLRTSLTGLAQPVVNARAHTHTQTKHIIPSVITTLSDCTQHLTIPAYPTAPA